MRHHLNGPTLGPCGNPTISCISEGKYYSQSARRGLLVLEIVQGDFKVKYKGVPGTVGIRLSLTPPTRYCPLGHAWGSERNGFALVIGVAYFFITRRGGTVSVNMFSSVAKHANTAIFNLSLEKIGHFVHVFDKSVAIDTFLFKLEEDLLIPSRKH